MRRIDRTECRRCDKPLDGSNKCYCKKCWSYYITANRYKIPIETVIEARRNGAECAICNEHSDSIKFDHCHKTGRYRGMLCHNCNTALGKFKDNVEILNNAINYITL